MGILMNFKPGLNIVNTIITSTVCTQAVNINDFELYDTLHYLI
jgi:hypothetical protein